MITHYLLDKVIHVCAYTYTRIQMYVCVYLFVRPYWLTFVNITKKQLHWKNYGHNPYLGLQI